MLFFGLLTTLLAGCSGEKPSNAAEPKTTEQTATTDASTDTVDQTALNNATQKVVALTEKLKQLEADKDNDQKAAIEATKKELKTAKIALSKEKSKAKKAAQKDFPAPPDVAQPPEDAIKTKSGLIYKVLTEGKGEDHPTDKSMVKVQYTGWNKAGKQLETTLHRKRPTAFPFKAMKPGFQEAALLMKKGAKVRLWMTPELATKGKKKVTEEVVYDFELVDFQKSPKSNFEPIPAPADVAAPPADASKTESGLAYKVLTKGTGTEKPLSGAFVTVNYTGWKTNGEMFDTSTKRKKPVSFGLGAVIPGWTEGLQLMVVGEKTRFWIPEELAYKGQKGKPEGMLVFDVELVSFKQPIPAPANTGTPPADANKTESGVFYQVVTAGAGAETPADGATVEFSYTAWDTEGKMLDSSKMKDRVPKAPMTRLPPPWQEVMKTMKKGETVLAWVPASLMPPRRGAPSEGNITFEFELVSFANPPKAPADVAAPPADASKTESGLAYKVLTQGTGTEKPVATNRVKVHYTGWTTDGKMFDSSLSRGTPATFGLNGVIPGWTEGLQLMVVGEKTRFWIPEELAYKGKQGRPQGMLVFDVELLEIK